MSLRHALLGLLYEGPASGYDLLNMFRHSLDNAWPATQSQVYTELTKLADAGLLSVSAVGPRGRKEYTLTNAGLAELHHWMLETEPERYQRSEALLRVFLLGAITADQAEQYLSWLAARAGEDTAALTAVDASIDWDNEDDLQFHGRLVLEFGKRFWTMSQEWADWAAQQVHARAAARHEPRQRNDQPDAAS